MSCHSHLNYSPCFFDETVNTEQKVAIGSNRITFKDTPKEQFFFSNLSGGSKVKAEWKLTDLKTTIGIQEIGNFKTDKINLWGWEHVVSPELFFKISVNPDKSCVWSRSYSIYSVK